MNETMPKVFVNLVCVTGRKEMSLEERIRHFTKCRHPQCVSKLARYEQIAQRCKEELLKPIQ